MAVDFQNELLRRFLVVPSQTISDLHKLKVDLFCRFAISYINTKIKVGEERFHKQPQNEFAFLKNNIIFLKHEMLLLLTFPNIGYE